MRVTTGKVVGGKVILDGDVFEDGTAVTVLARDEDETFEVSPKQESELLAAIAEADRGELVTAEQILKNIRRPA